MRNEVENLQQQQYQNQLVSTAVEGTGDPILETRLRQTTFEVSKLQKERRKLIDISNELQAQINTVSIFS